MKKEIPPKILLLQIIRLIVIAIETITMPGQKRSADIPMGPDPKALQSQGLSSSSSETIPEAKASSVASSDNTTSDSKSEQALSMSEKFKRLKASIPPRPAFEQV